MKTRVVVTTILLFALWWCTGFFTTAGLVASIGLPVVWRWPMLIGFANAVLGMLLLVALTSNPEGWRLFYEGKKEEEETGPITPRLLLWVLPLVFVLAGAFWWLLALVRRFFERLSQ